MELVPPVGDDLPKAADDLFALSLGEFTRRRNDLAKKLKADGDAKGSAEVAALAKPTLAAWALNQLARKESNLITELIKADETLRNPASRLESREASKVRNEIIKKIVSAASGTLEAQGHSAGPGVTQKITQVLLAVGADEDGAKDLAAGRLQRDLQPGGLGDPSWASGSGAGDQLQPDNRDQLEAQRQRKVLSEEISRLADTAEELRHAAELAEDDVTDARIGLKITQDKSMAAQKKLVQALKVLKRKREELP